MNRIENFVTALIPPWQFFANEEPSPEMLEQSQTLLRSRIEIYPVQKQSSLCKRLIPLLKTKIRQLSSPSNIVRNRKTLFIQELLKVIPLQDYIPLCPYEACPEANVDEFFLRSVTLYVHSGDNWSVPEKIRYLSALLRLGISGHPVCHAELGDCYTQLHSWEKASHCYALALDSKCSPDLQLKFIKAVTKRERGCSLEEVALLKRTGSDTVQTIQMLSAINDLSKRNLWLEALDIAQKGFTSSQVPVVFLQKIVDIYISLSRQSSFIFILQNFWPLAKRVVGRIGQTPDESWNTESVKAVLELIDYICAQHNEAEKLLLYLTRSVPYKDSTLSAFISYLVRKHDEIAVRQIDANRSVQQLIERLMYRDFADAADRAEVTTLFVNLREMFLGSQDQSIPLGLLHYVKQYALFLQNSLALAATYPDKEQAVLFEPHFRSQIVRFSTLHDSLRETFTRITTVLATLYEWRSSRFASRQKVEVSETMPTLIAEGNLFTYVTKTFVPGEARDNVTLYLENHGIPLDLLFSSTLTLHTPNTHGANPNEFTELQTFLKTHNVTDVASLRNFLLKTKKR